MNGSNPIQPVDPAKDKRMAAAFYGIAVSPVDGSVWGSRRDFRAPSSASIPVPIRPRPRSRSTEVPFEPKAVTVSAAWISTATAWSGRRCRAAIWRASTGANAKDRLTAQRNRQALCRRLDAAYAAGTELRERERTGAVPSRVTTLGSISSTPSAWAKTCRSPPAT